MLPLILSVLFLVGDPTKLTVPIVDPRDLWVEQLHQCENPDNVPWIWDTNGKKSFGALQFQLGTWLTYGKKFGATKDNISDDYLQRQVAKGMLDNGLSYHWKACSARVRASLGEYPNS